MDFRYIVCNKNKQTYSPLLLLLSTYKDTSWTKSCKNSCTFSAKKERKERDDINEISINIHYCFSREEGARWGSTMGSKKH